MTAIVVAYRQDSSNFSAQAVCEFLAARLGQNNLVFGVDALVEPGDIARESIARGVQSAEVLLVLIDPHWTDTDWTNNPNDNQMIAISTALETGRRIVPVLIDGAEAPSPVGLNARIASLLERTPFIVRGEDDKLKLTQFLQKFVKAQPAARVEPLGFNPEVEKPLFGQAAAADASGLTIEDNAIIARLATPDGNQAYLSVMPHAKSATRTKIPNGAHLIVLSRTIMCDWLNVGYISTTGQVLVGWVPTTLIKDVQYQGRGVELLDLPITNYEYNTHEDINSMLGHLNSSYMSLLGCGFNLVFLFGALPYVIAFVTYLIVRDMDIPGYQMFNITAGIWVVGLVAYYVWWVKAGYKESLSEVSDRIRELRSIRRQKTGAGTNMLWDIGKLALAASSVAVGLGGGYMAMQNRNANAERAHEQQLASKGAYRRRDYTIK